jgi:hypothetical protein
LYGLNKSPATTRIQKQPSKYFECGAREIGRSTTLRATSRALLLGQCQPVRQRALKRHGVELLPATDERDAGAPPRTAVAEFIRARQ